MEGFTIGMRTLGDGRGVEDSTFTLSRIVNNRIGLDIWCATATAWNTSIRYYGGHFAHATGVNAAQDRFGVRFGNEAGATSNHTRPRAWARDWPMIATASDAAAITSSVAPARASIRLACRSGPYN